jgi:hypothetical protein
VQDEPFSMVTLAVNDGVMAGTVHLPTDVYEISYAGNGVHTVAEIDQSAFPPEAEPIQVGLPEGALGDAVPETAADDGSVIDVMVVYTPAARAAVGGSIPMQNLINLAVTETNQTYGNSAIVQRLNLVHMEEVFYMEAVFEDALYALTDPDDGKMDNVHSLRDAYAADEVVLIVNDTEYCGIAWLMQDVSTSFQDHAFAVVHWSCATGYYSFGHELGHNMGAQHDWYVVNKYNQPQGAFPYSYGYVNSEPAWRTVMAYGEACDNCLRIAWWSNPDVGYFGTPVGTDSADNHRTLNNTAWTVANFRQSVVDSPPDAPTNLTAAAVSPVQINLSWTDNSSDEDGFQIQRSLTGVTWTPFTSVAANTTSYVNTGLTPLTTYYYRVRAYNDDGESDYSNVASATTPRIIIGPLVYDRVAIDDDNAGGTVGNDNGAVNCGETVGLTVMLGNEGNTAVEGIDSTLSAVGGTGQHDIGEISPDTSPYPDIAGGASAGNTQAFEFSVIPLAEHGHWIDFELAIDADNWSGSPIEFSLPILCAATADYQFYLPMVSK